MKKNITINLFGSLYAIDEDAYDLLKRYEENMRSYFRRKEGGEEISADIEYRVAELLAELKANGTEAITIEHVEEIIRRIGNPEQMDDDGEDREAAAEPRGGEAGGDGGEKENMRFSFKGWLSGRKLFRDTQDSLVGGVMSGLCHFFGGTDPLPWRIGMVLLCLFSFSTVAIIYLILWAFVPQARTAEERLQMHGRPVSAESINEELMRGVAKASDAVADAAGRMRARGFASSLIRFVLFCFKAALFMGGCVLLFILLMVILFLGYSTFNGAEALVDIGVFSSEAVGVWNLIPGAYWLLWLLAGSLSVAVVIILYVLTRWMANSEPPLGSRTRVTLLLVWLAAVAVAFCSAVFFCIQASKASKRYDEQCNTYNGFYLNRSSWDALRDGGWEVLAMQGCAPYVHGSVRDPRTGDMRRTYSFEAKEGDTAFRFHIRRSEAVQPGLYRLEALVSGNGRGGYVYAQLLSDSTRTHLAYALSPGESLPQSQLRTDAQEYAENSDDHSISNWEELQHVVTDTIRLTGGAITYGVTNDSRVTGVPCNGNNFQLVAIDLVRVGDDAPVAAVPAKKATRGKKH